MNSSGKVPETKAAHRAIGRNQDVKSLFGDEEGTVTRG